MDATSILLQLNIDSNECELPACTGSAAISRLGVGRAGTMEGCPSEIAGSDTMDDCGGVIAAQ